MTGIALSGYEVRYGGERSALHAGRRVGARSVLVVVVVVGVTGSIRAAPPPRLGYCTAGREALVHVSGTVYTAGQATHLADLTRHRALQACPPSRSPQRAPLQSNLSAPPVHNSQRTGPSRAQHPPNPLHLPPALPLRTTNRKTPLMRIPTFEPIDIHNRKLRAP